MKWILVVGTVLALGACGDDASSDGAGAVGDGTGDVSDGADQPGATATASGIPADTMGSDLSEQQAEMLCTGLAMDIAVIEDDRIQCTDRALEDASTVAECVEIRDNCLEQKEEDPEDGMCDSGSILEGLEGCSLPIGEFEACVAAIADSLRGLDCEADLGNPSSEPECLDTLLEQCPNIGDNNEDDRQGGDSSDGARDMRGQISVRIDNLTGHEGDTLIGTAARNGEPVGGLCLTVDSAAFSTTVAFRQLRSSDDPCDLGDPVLFDPLGYSLDLNVYRADSMQVLACTNVGVNVDDGDVEVTAPTFTNQCGG